MVKGSSDFNHPPRDGFHLSELFGRVCWKHGRFTFDCGCEPEKETKDVRSD